jgi:hypothetical protein
MKTIQATTIIGDDRKLSLQLPAEVSPGEHRILIVIDDQQPAPPKSWTIDDWPIHDEGLLDERITMRREEMYGDHGR